MKRGRRALDAGVLTVEGLKSGDRAAKLAKERQELVELLQRKEQERKEGAAVPTAQELKNVRARFRREVLASDAAEGTYGLKTREEFLEAQSELQRTRVVAAEGTGSNDDKAEDRGRGKHKRDKKRRKREKAERKKKKTQALLSFGADEEEEEGDGPGAEPQAATQLTKNPEVETDFLPDRERDERLRREERKRQEEWAREQDKIKQQKLKVVYSFWDGRGHRNKITVTKGTSVGEFLELVRKQLVSRFKELRASSADRLMYVKEDLIIPNFVTFYDLITSKSRGISGVLNDFTVKDDVRLVTDVRVAGQEAHAGKVCERFWYERNKHIFPASKWKVFDPTAEPPASAE
ncbi:Protein XAP5 CIRCADIAN TIMEKEEPER [Durusdinium trenchii]|uniref:Protein XAP5 CIRCADIAN TIMEKEEPER n=1 Tax=Durusdinium trenchii TaxID=1381693 RepID=A0ABP0LWB2_9DINO